MSLSRRQFVRSALSASVVSLLPFRFPLGVGAQAHAQVAGGREWPIQPVGPHSSRVFNGDEVERTHRVLWDIAGFIRQAGGLPPPSEDHEVVVVGGGIAGLTAAYALRDRRPLLLEQDSAFGGNSKGESVGPSVYSIGAAYIVAPKPGSPVARFLAELGLGPHARGENSSETTVFMNNRFAKGFWQAVTDPAARSSFDRFFRILVDFNHRFEASSGDEPWIMDLDKMTFQQWLNASVGSLHPHLHEYLQLYAWSSFTASLDEISAYQMLEFIASETGTLVAFPGGNAAIAQALYGRLRSSLGAGQVRSRSLVLRVQPEADHVLVSYLDPEGRLRTVRARTVVCAAPKFVAKHLVQGVPPEQARAMNSISYRGYVVANLILDQRVSSPSYELYCLTGEVPPSPTPRRQSQRPFTDVIFGSWAQHDRVDRSVLTIYKAFAFDGDRQYLFNPATHDKFRGQILEGAQPLLQALGLTPQNIQAVRMTRWGHSLPVAWRGMLASGVAERAHQPVAGRVFFANQDNWVNPSFETAFEEALRAAQGARGVLSHSS